MTGPTVPSRQQATDPAEHAPPAPCRMTICTCLADGRYDEREAVGIPPGYMATLRQDCQIHARMNLTPLVPAVAKDEIAAVGKGGSSLSTYQVFPDLSASEYDSLREDIRLRGVLIPVEIDADTSEVLDGHHRLRIARELGIEAPTVARSFASDADRLAHVIALNLKRRHLDPVTWGEFAIRYAETKGVRLGSSGGRPTKENPATVAGLARDLGVPQRTLERRIEAARLPEPLREQIKSGERTVRTALQEHKRTGRIEAAVRRETDGSRLLLGERKTYQTLVVDPPWAYDRDDIRGAALHHYDTMTFEEIAAYPIGQFAAENCHLYLWITNPHLPHVWRIVEAWGFEYKTLLTWVKPQIGTGHYFRGATEHVLFCVRGTLPLRDASLPNWFLADRTEHSAKPAAFYELAGRASFGPFAEFFAREKHDGWDAYGDEAGE